MNRAFLLIALGAIVAALTACPAEAAVSTWAGNRIKVERERDGIGEIVKIVSPRGRVLEKIEAPNGDPTWELVELDGKAPKELRVEVALGARGAPAHYFFGASGKFHRIGFLFGAYIDLKLKDLDRNGTQELIVVNSVSYMDGISGAEGAAFKYAAVYTYREGRLRNISQKQPAIIRPYLTQAKNDLPTNRKEASEIMEGVPAAAAWYCCAVELGIERQAEAEIVKQLSTRQRQWFKRFKRDIGPSNSDVLPLTDQ